MRARLLPTLALIGLVAHSHAQFDDLLKGKIKIKLPTLAELTQGEAPLTTNIKDVTFYGWPEFDRINPADYVTLTNADRNKNHLYTLKPGHYKLELKSFCARGYTYGPTDGMGYFDAPWKGSKVKFFKELLAAYNQKPDVDQKNIQLLIWATLARVKPDELKGPARQALIDLLGDKGLKMMAEGALSHYAEDAMKPLFRQADRAMQPFLEYDNKIRGLFADANASYSEFERLAVLPAPAEPLRSIIPKERWNIHPNGYMFRADVRGYSRTSLEIIVPRKLEIIRDTLGRIAEMKSDDFKLAISYQTEAEPFLCPEDSNMKGYLVSQVAISSPLGQVVSEKSDWVFVGKPQKGKSKAETQLSALLPQPYPSPFQNPFERWRDRYERAQELRDRIETYEEYMDRMNRAERGERPDGDLFDTGNIRDMIDSLFGGTEDRLGVIADTHMRMAEHLGHATSVIGSLGDGSEVNPSDGIFAPANAGGQNIMSSANSW